MAYRDALFLKDSKEGTLISVIVAPRAKRSRIIGPHGDHLKIAIAAPAIEGRANKALVTFLSEVLNLPKSSIIIHKGESSKFKLVLVQGMSTSVIYQSLSLQKQVEDF